MTDIEPMHILEQFKEAGNAVGDDTAPGLSTRCRRVSSNAFWGEVAHHPSKGVRSIGPQMLEPALEFFLGGSEIRGLLHVHKVWTQGKHDRGFDKASVNAQSSLLIRNQALRVAEPGPACGGSQHAESHAKLCRHNGEQRRVPSMGVQYDQFSHTGFELPGTDVDPPVRSLLEWNASGCAGIGVLDRIANLLDGKKNDIQMLGDFFFDFFYNALRDDPVGIRGQMRAVLLCRSNWQDRNFLCDSVGVILCIHSVPRDVSRNLSGKTLIQK